LANGIVIESPQSTLANILAMIIFCQCSISSKSCYAPKVCALDPFFALPSCWQKK
jgi:hypothetical protein